MNPIPMNPLEGFGVAAGWQHLTGLVLAWLALFVVAATGVIVAKVMLARRRQHLICPEEYRTIGVVYVTHDAGGAPVDVTACSLRPGEQPVRCSKSCLHEAA